MKTDDLRGTRAVPVTILGNGEVFSFRVDPHSDVTFRGSRLIRADNHVLAVFGNADQAAQHSHHFVGCPRATYSTADDAFDLTKEEPNEPV